MPSGHLSLAMPTLVAELIVSYKSCYHCTTRSIGRGELSRNRFQLLTPSQTYLRLSFLRSLLRWECRERAVRVTLLPATQPLIQLSDSNRTFKALLHLWTAHLDAVEVKRIELACAQPFWQLPCCGRPPAELGLSPNPM